MRPKFPSPIIQAIPLSPDDNLYIEAITGVNNCVLNIQGTAINLQGDIVNFNEILNVSSPGVLFTKTCQLGYSFLLSANVNTFSLTVPDGDVYVRISLINPFTTSPFFRRKILDQGYVSTYSGISYGSGSVSKRNSVPQFYRSIEPANPAAGANFSYDIPGFVQVFIMSVGFTLVNSAAVASRYPGIELRSPTGRTLNFLTSFNSTASQTYNISFNATANVQLAIGPQAQCAFAPQYLGPGCNIRSNIFGLQAGDQISNVVIHVMQVTLPSNF